MKRDIKSMLLPELEEYFVSTGEKPYRAKQIFRWLHRGAESFGCMTDLSEALRDKLCCAFYITAPEIAGKQVSKQDGTIKYLWRMADGAAIESVVMKYDRWNTVCISTQAGCAMGCAFCASAIGGLERNLTPSEMLDQVLFSQIDSGLKISNVVLMGIGEPLDNFDNVMQFLQLVSHPAGRNIGARHITVSTCGIIENIDKLAAYSIQLTVTASLHAPDDETRNRLMPINNTNGVDALIDACNRYFAKTGRRISYEYALIDGVNDTAYHAGLLADKLGNSGNHVNIILLNDVPERKFDASSRENTKAFIGILAEKGVNYTIRRKLGDDIDASCGQLRRRRV